MEIHILLPAHKEAVLEFARARLTGDDMERELESWSARWRGEALDHYLALGWSFGAFDAQGKLLGFLLAQPILFHRGLAQTLWVEQLCGEGGAALLDTVYRWARDKHFQCVLLEDQVETRDLLPRGGHPVEPLLEIRSARY